MHIEYYKLNKKCLYNRITFINFLAELLQSSWSPYTELLPVLENIFTNERPNVAFLKRILRAAKPHFLNVFKNPVSF